MSESYELFDSEKYCETRLPVNTIKDEFFFIGFMPLKISKNGNNTQPVSIPRDLINPEIMRRARFELGALGGFLPDDVLRGVPFNPDWNNWRDPLDGVEFTLPTSEGGTFVVEDTVTFLRHPRMTLASGETVDLQIPRARLREILFNGATKLVVKIGNKRVSVNIVARQPGSGGGGVGMDARFALSSANTWVDLPGSQFLDIFDLEKFQKMVDFFAPPKLDFVLSLPYLQTWKMMGYSRGELINTISLAPEEETTIEILTWDRLTQSREESTSTEREGLLEASFTDKDTTQTIKETTKENRWDINANIGVTIPVKGVNINLGVDGGAEESITKVNKETRERVAEAVHKSSLKIKSSRQIKISEKRETGREDTLTRKIKNPNKSRTLNLDYFEILVGYEVSTKLDREKVRLCVLVPNLIKDKLDRNFLLNYMGVIKNALLSNIFDEGLEAAKKLAAWERLCFVKCIEPCPCDEEISGGSGDMDPQAPSDQGIVESTLDVLIKACKELRQILETLSKADWDAYCDLPPFRTKKNREAFIREKANYHRWVFWQIANDRNPRLGDAAAIFLEASTDLDKPNLQQQEKARLVLAAETFLKSIDANLLGDLLDILTLPFKVLGTILETLFLSINFTKHKFYCSARLLIEIGVENENLPRTIKKVEAALGNYNKTISAAPQGSLQQKGEIPGDPIGIAEPPYSDKEIAEALVMEKALIGHITNHESYYRQAIWRSFSIQDQLRLLSLLGKVADFVEPEVLGFVGDKVVMPYRIDHDAKLEKWLETQKQQALDEEVKTDTLTLPTKGFVMESRLGQCESLEEYLLAHRQLDVEMTKAQSEMLVYESRRREMRLNADPPLLDAFDNIQEPEVSS